MKHYDVIIVGAGIAGCGLAYNLKRIGYGGSILLIDKGDIGNNRGYGHKVLMKKTIKEYHLPYTKKFNGLKIGPLEKVEVTIKRPDYFSDYKEVCETLFRKTNVDYLNAKAKNIQKSLLICDKGLFGFRYLIDCSGSWFFSRRLQKKVLPDLYWVGIVRRLEGKLTGINKNYYYYMFGEKGGFEDLYEVNGKILHGYWQYTKKIDFNQIKISKKSFFKNHVKDYKIELQKPAVIPNAPVFPLVHKNIALLGDSFGIPYPASGLGLDPTLESSKILALAIKKNNLRFYEKKWKKRYLDSYSKFLASRLNRYTHLNSKFIQRIKRKYPENVYLLKYLNKDPSQFNKVLDNDVSVNIDMALDKFPKYNKLFAIYYYLLLRVKYFLMSI